MKITLIGSCNSRYFCRAATLSRQDSERRIDTPFHRLLFKVFSRRESSEAARSLEKSEHVKHVKRRTSEAIFYS